MRLVRLDETINRACNETCGCDRKDCKWAHFGPVHNPHQACTVVKKMEKEAVVVDAIPITWLRAKQHELKSYYDHRPDAVVDYLIWLWDKENVDANGDANN